jgi:hypothetical protein
MPMSSIYANRRHLPRRAQAFTRWLAELVTSRLAQARGAARAGQTSRRDGVHRRPDTRPPTQQSAVERAAAASDVSAAAFRSSVRSDPLADEADVPARIDFPQHGGRTQIAAAREHHVFREGFRWTHA